MDKIKFLGSFALYTEELKKTLEGAMKKEALAVIREAKGKGSFKVIATTEDVDRDGEVIKIDGWDFNNFMKNPIILWAHNYWELDAIVGAAKNITVENGEVVIEGVFADTPAGQMVRKLYEDGIIRTVSVGFIPKNRDGNLITQAELLEVSFVPVPSNPNALAAGKMFEANYLQNKAVVPFEETPKAPENYEWDADEAEKRVRAWATEKDEEGKEKINFEKYMKAFTWYDAERPDLVSSYKLPHHDIIDNELVVVWQGAVAAMGALLGARGGVDIPDADKEKVYNHLSETYGQFDREPPVLSGEEPEKPEKDFDIEDFKAKVVDFVQSYKMEETKKDENGEETKTGRVLSSKSLELVEKAIAALSELRDHASVTEEPDEKDIDPDLLLKLARGVDKTVEEMITTLKKGRA